MTSKPDEELTPVTGQPALRPVYKLEGPGAQGPSKAIEAGDRRLFLLRELGFLLCRKGR